MRGTIGRRALIGLLAVVGVVLVVISNPRDSDSRCVGGRFAVKTLSDSDEVKFKPIPTRVEALRQLHRPRRLPKGARSSRVEATTYAVRARLVSMVKRSTDEIDVIVSAPKNPSATMAVGFEGARICGHQAVIRADGPMKRARHALIAACGNPTDRRTALSGTADISGVGFFGMKHTLGAAGNGIELHPVLRFQSSDCGRRR